MLEKEAQSRMNVLQQYQVGWGRGQGMGMKVYGERSTIKDECATAVSSWMG